MKYYSAIKMSETDIWTNMDSSIKQNVEWKEKSWKIFESMKPFFNIINIQNTHTHTHTHTHTINTKFMTAVTSGREAEE